MDKQSDLVSMGKARVICVDDDPITRALIKAKIERLTSDFVEAEDGIVAWNMMRQGSFDIAFIDLEMPNLDGFNLLRCLRGDAKTRHMPVVVISSRDDTSAVRMVFEAGASSFQPKPINWSLFEPQVAHLLRLASSSRELEARAEALTIYEAEAEVNGRLLSSLSEVLTHLQRSAEMATAIDDMQLKDQRLREIAAAAGELARHAGGRVSTSPTRQPSTDALSA